MSKWTRRQDIYAGLELIGFIRDRDDHGTKRKIDGLLAERAAQGEIRSKKNGGERVYRLRRKSKRK